ncbi:EpsG family protein [Rhodomicrobium vannielii ATCC 17100]|uniref:EpsG family protein n=1 Tax=Rhodomicrobium vannielii TaxID=1069 RepID=UPI00191B1F87|nr:EpsG family protein [Rhodomicrobium vannielii]MBJ7533227.1 EpsG family protein [Rhodomicrobium vannielii ATCC 17100]
MIYVASYAALLLAGFLSFKSVQLRRALFPIVALFLFLFVAFRYEVGCDWSGYQNNYLSAQYLTVEDAVSGQEPGYWLLLTQLHSFGFEYPYLNVLMAMLFFWGLTRLAVREPNPLAILILAFPVLVINLPMSGIRQGAAVGMICLALNAFRSRQPITYVALVVFASLFHTSALAFLALAPFVKFRVTRATLILSGILVLPSALFLLTDKVAFYSDRYVDTGVDAAGAIYRTGMLAVVGGYFLLVLRRAYLERFPADYKLALIGAWTMLGTLALLPVSSVISDRFGYYVAPIQLMIMARTPYLIRGRSRLFLSAAPYAALGVVLVVWTSFSDLFKQCYVPYQTWLDWPL